MMRPRSKRRSARWRRADAHAPAQGEDRIEHRTDLFESGRPSIAAIAVRTLRLRPMKSNPIGLNLGFSNHATIDDSEMCSPDFSIGRGSPSAGR